ncbi:MAG: NAD kinase [Sphingomonadaceae bacterium]|nr:NAD kinase [Sphingomonadaceae bacterium]
MRMALQVSPTAQAQAAAELLRPCYDWHAVRDAEVVVALGGDGFLLQVLHAALHARQPRPVFGMNLGSVGFLMNEFRVEDLPQRLAAARSYALHPLAMTARTVGGEVTVSPAINEVSLLREARQAAKLEISVDGTVRMAEIACDGILVATPAGSTAYNLSANGSILPLQADLLALTPISPFRPRRWRGALLPQTSVVEFRVLEAGKRPVSAVADQIEVRDVAHVRVVSDKSVTLDLLFDPGHTLEDRIFSEQFES